MRIGYKADETKKDTFLIIGSLHRVEGQLPQRLTTVAEVDNVMFGFLKKFLSFSKVFELEELSAHNRKGLMLI